MPDWDRIFKERGRVFTEPHTDIDRIAKLIKDRNGVRVLDLGCGTGRHIVYLSKLGFDVWGFDASPMAVTMTKEWLAEENLKANLQKHQMEDVFPYEDDFFDAVISIQVIHHNLKRDIRKTIYEIERVLKPGGIIFVTVPIWKPGPVSEEDDWKLVKVEEGTYVPQRGWESGIPHHYFSEDELHDEFSAFSIHEVFLDETDHRCVIAELRSS
jgi:SAM-dependent methyltransferase